MGTVWPGPSGMKRATTFVVFFPETHHLCLMMRRPSDKSQWRAIAQNPDFSKLSNMDHDSQEESEDVYLNILDETPELKKSIEWA